MKTYAFIFARGGSKGIPGKNIRLMAGKPLLAWSIEIAQETPEIKRVIVSTDSEEIKELTLLYGGKVIDRPKKLTKTKTS